MKKFFVFSSLLIFTLASSASYKVASDDEVDIFADYSYEQKEEIKERQRQFKVNGYYKTYSEAAVGLREVETRRHKGVIETADDPYYETLRASPKGFPLDFTYNGISSVNLDHLLGYVPSGTEIPEKYNWDNFYWTGVTGYFLDDRFGTCRHVIEKMGVNPSSGDRYLAITYDPKFTTYEINGKPTTKFAQGDEQSGYIYEITWTGKTYDKGLECTNSKPFDLQTTKDLIDYAKKLDNDLPDTP